MVIATYVKGLQQGYYGHLKLNVALMLDLFEMFMESYPGCVGNTFGVKDPVTVVLRVHEIFCELSERKVVSIKPKWTILKSYLDLQEGDVFVLKKTKGANLHFVGGLYPHQFDPWVTDEIFAPKICYKLEF